ARLPLNRLDHNSNGRGADAAPDRGHVVELRLPKPRHLRFEQQLECFLAGCRHGREGTAVKSTVERNYLVSSMAMQGSVLACKLDCAFVGLGPAVCEEHLV